MSEETVPDPTLIHDLRNALNVIAAAAQIIEMVGDDREKVRRQVDLIRRSVDIMEERLRQSKSAG